jgi:hypothetical protein
VNVFEICESLESSKLCFLFELVYKAKYNQIKNHTILVVH